MTSQPRTTTAPTPLATPIAITGVACRLPGGVDSADALWELLRSGRDAVGEVPQGRWNADELAALERDASSRPPRWVGGFLDGDPGAFDAEFFHISHEEARLLDPQHRMLLEVAWEACEHAGLPTAELAGSNTGVFAGMCNTDHATYAPWLAGGGGPYHMTGNQFGTARPGGSRTRWGCAAPVWRSTPRARRASSRRTSHARACSSASPTWRSPARRTSCSARGSSPPTTSSGCCRRAGAARPSTARPTGTCAPRAS